MIVRSSAEAGARPILPASLTTAAVTVAALFFVGVAPLLWWVREGSGPDAATDQRR